MVVQHISEILRELYNKKAREDLYAIANHGLNDILDSGKKEELGFLMQCQTISAHEIKAAQYEYLLNNLWKN